MHTLGAGTDAGQAWMLVLTAVVVLAPLVALGMRWRARLELPVPIATSHPPPG